LVLWSGRCGDVATATANVRSAEAALDSPSLWLNAQFTQDLDQIRVNGVKDVSIASDLSIQVDKRAKLASTGEMVLQGDHGVARLRNAFFETGQ
jgi:hypothetical protein